MVKKQIIIIAIIISIIILGFLSFSNIAENLITGAVIKPIINTEYFRINNFGIEINEDEEEKLDGTQNSSRSG